MATVPVGPGYSHWEPLLEEPGHRSESVSGLGQFRARGFRRWRVSCGWRGLTEAEAAPILRLLMAAGPGTALEYPRFDGGATGAPATLRARYADGGMDPWRQRENGLWDISLDLVEDPRPAPAAAAPAALSGLAAAAAAGGIVLTWTDPRDVEIVRYEIQVRTAGTAWTPWTPVPGSHVGTVSHTVAGAAGAYIRAKLRAVSSAGAGPSTPTASPWHVEATPT